MRLSKIFYPLLFAFVLLFAQQGSVVHGLRHSLTQQTQDHSLPQDKLCDLCAVYAQIGSAIGSSSLVLSSAAAEFFYVSAAFSGYASSPFIAFAARAPPASV